MMDKKKFTGIGELQFLGANQIILNEEFGGLSLMYSAIHGEEDKKFQPNPANEEAFLENFKEICIEHFLADRGDYLDEDYTTVYLV